MSRRGANLSFVSVRNQRLSYRLKIKAVCKVSKSCLQLVEKDKICVIETEERNLRSIFRRRDNRLEARWLTKRQFPFVYF